MSNFFKALGKGIIYIVTLPLLLVFLAVYFIVSLFSFLIIGIKGIILFFKGENIMGDLKEDVEAKKRMAILQDPLSLIQQEIKKQEQNINPQIDKNNALDNSFSQVEQKPILQIESSSTTPTEPEEEKIVEIHEPNDVPIPEEEITSASTFADALNNIEGNNNIKEVSVDNSHIIETDEYIGDMYKEERPSNTVSSYDKED